MRKLPPPRNTNPLIVRLVELINDGGIDSFELCRRAGLGTGAIHAWRHHSNPGVNNLEAVLNALGYELKIERRENVPGLQ
jgi:DNA-binding phage protein